MAPHHIRLQNTKLSQIWNNYSLHVHILWQEQSLLRRYWKMFVFIQYHYFSADLFVCLLKHHCRINTSEDGKLYVYVLIDIISLFSFDLLFS